MNKTPVTRAGDELNAPRGIQDSPEVEAARDELDRVLRESEEQERRRSWLERAMERVSIPHAIVLLIVIGWAEFGMFPRTRYGLWWRRSWPKVLIVGGAGIAALEIFLHPPLFADPAMIALGVMMIVGGALNLRRPTTATSATAKSSGQGRDADQTPK
jgi:hypothetical protein